jgi:hypothetical protein
MVKAMPDSRKSVLSSLRASLARKVEGAYIERDEAGDDDFAAAYAEGESHAYSVAEHEVRTAQNALGGGKRHDERVVRS